MPNYEIVDFIYERLKNDEEAWKNEDNLKKKAKNLDTKNVMNPFFGVDWLNKRKAGQSLGSRIDDANQDYIQKITSEIDRANTQTELNRIDIDTDYKEETQYKLMSYIADKAIETISYITIKGKEVEIPATFQRGRPRDEVREVTQALAGEYINEVQSATTRAEAMDIPFPSNIPNTMISTLRSIREDVIDSLPE